MERLRMLKLFPMKLYKLQKEKHKNLYRDIKFKLNMTFINVVLIR